MKHLVRTFGHLSPWLTIAAGILLIPLNIALRYQIGRWAGMTAMGVFILTLLPGMIRRFRLSNSSIGKTLTQYLLPIRRQLGITMFLLATLHLLALRWEVFQEAFQGMPPEPRVSEQLGFLGLFLLLPLFLTSNTWSTKLLKRNWKRLHRLTYIAGWLIFGHIALQGNIIQSILIGGVMITEMCSLIYTRVQK